MMITEEMKEKAKTVMKVTFSDGNTGAFFGLGKTRQGTINLNMELRRHKNQVAKWGDKVMEAVIYKNRYPAKDGDPKRDLMMKFENGVWK